MWKMSELIKKGKFKLYQLAGKDPAEIVVSFTKYEIDKLWTESESQQKELAAIIL